MARDPRLLQLSARRQPLHVGCFSTLIHTCPVSSSSWKLWSTTVVYVHFIYIYRVTMGKRFGTVGIHIPFFYWGAVRNYEKSFKPHDSIIQRRNIQEKQGIFSYPLYFPVYFFPESWYSCNKSKKCFEDPRHQFRKKHEGIVLQNRGSSRSCVQRLASWVHPTWMHYKVPRAESCLLIEVILYLRVGANPPKIFHEAKIVGNYYLIGVHYKIPKRKKGY